MTPTPPEEQIPDELWGIYYPPSERIANYGDGEIVAYSSESGAKARCEPCEPDEDMPVLIGVHPRHREALLEIAAIVNGSPYHGHLDAIAKIRDIVAEACGKSDTGEGETE